MTTVSIIGTGMAGCGAVHRLSQQGVPTKTYDMKSHFGGHTASFEFPGGFTFDEGPHVSFTTNDRIKDLLAEGVNGQFFEARTHVNNYWKGHWIKHPAQVNLNGLPDDLVVDCIEDFVHASRVENPRINNYEDWLLAMFGETFARTFPMEYTKKYHTTDARNMSTDWIGPRLYRPELKEVLRGAIKPQTDDVHYIGGFRYPKTGGFAAFIAPFMQKTDLKLDHKLTGVDPKSKTLRFANGASERYEKLVSSMPLPDLIPTIDNVPDDVLSAAEKLSCSEVVIVSLGIARPELLNAHWTYFYDSDIFFTRLSTPHLQSPLNVPEGCSSLQAECYYSKKYRPLDRAPNDCIEPVIKDLVKCGVLDEADKIVFKHAMHIPYANVIFDLERKEALSTVHGYLRDIGVHYCGRYGDWAYTWTDQAFVSGENAAQRAVDE